eukprot:728897-Alexandrium_andersonii.AAC.1
MLRRALAARPTLRGLGMSMGRPTDCGGPRGRAGCTAPLGTGRCARWPGHRERRASLLARTDHETEKAKDKDTEKHQDAYGDGEHDDTQKTS